MIQALTLTLAGIDGEEAALVGMVLSIGFLFYLVHSIRRMRETREKEQTRREIAAYVAEKSITADEGVRLMTAAAAEDPAAAIADGVAWGVVSPAKAEKLIMSLRSGQGAQAPAPAASP
jgi:hypothetical protein